MTIKSKLINNNYIGPKALFDPNYVPPQLLHRKKEVNSLRSLLNDSFTDNFSLNVLYQGIQGIGKRVIVNKVLNDIFLQNKEPKTLHIISVDCRCKNFKDLIISLISEMRACLNLEFDYDLFLSSKLSNAWNIFKLMCKKLNNNLLLIFNNIEQLKSNSFKKLLHFGKESKITLITTANRIQRSSTLDLLGEFDLKTKLSFFSYKELCDILKQRVSLAFFNEIDDNLIEFMADLVFDRYVPVPGKGIDILRDFYPILKNRAGIQQFEILEISNPHFDLSQASDEFSLLSYLAEEDILTILFLDNLSDYFLKSNSSYYITSRELTDIYEISCESLEYDKNFDRFKEMIGFFINLGFLHLSKKNSVEKEKDLINYKDYYEFYFISINPKKLKAMIDAIFSNLN